jgi:tRNA pseudouridine32 synthase/23S rRNA pseudouridine746 synthase
MTGVQALAHSTVAPMTANAPPIIGVHWTGDDFAVIEKPAGLLSVPGRGDGKSVCVESLARSAFPHAAGPIIVHRLDMETSGLMVLGLDREAHRALSRQFIHRKVGKSYVALLDGIVEGDQGAIELPLIVDWPNRPRQIVDSTRGKPSRTLWRVIDRDLAVGITRVEFRPMTGRTHQLRVHAATPRDLGGLGCPILGDSLYGDRTRASRLMLHANHLAFWQPSRASAWLKFTSDPPF